MPETKIDTNWKLFLQNAPQVNKIQQVLNMLHGRIIHLETTSERTSHQLTELQKSETELRAKNTTLEIKISLLEASANDSLAKSHFNAELSPIENSTSACLERSDNKINNKIELLETKIEDACEKLHDNVDAVERLQRKIVDTRKRVIEATTTMDSEFPALKKTILEVDTGLASMALSLDGHIETCNGRSVSEGRCRESNTKSIKLLEDGLAGTVCRVNGHIDLCNDHMVSEAKGAESNTECIKTLQDAVDELKKSSNQIPALVESTVESRVKKHEEPTRKKSVEWEQNQTVSRDVMVLKTRVEALEVQQSTKDIDEVEQKLERAEKTMVYLAQQFEHKNFQLLRIHPDCQPLHVLAPACLNNFLYRYNEHIRQVMVAIAQSSHHMMTRSYLPHSLPPRPSAQVPFQQGAPRAHNMAAIRIQRPMINPPQTNMFPVVTVASTPLSPPPKSVTSSAQLYSNENKPIPEKIKRIEPIDMSKFLQLEDPSDTIETSSTSHK